MPSPHCSPKSCKNKECKKKIEELEKEIEDLRKQLKDCKKKCEDQKKQCEKEKEELQNKIDELEKNQCCCGGNGGGIPNPSGQWVPAANGEVPVGAVLSGPKPKYYVSRAKMDTNLVPGKLTPDHKTCWVAWNNTEIKMQEYEVLVNTNCKWIAFNSTQNIPAKAIKGGYIDHSTCRETLYIGRANIGDIVVPGYVFDSNKELLHSTSYKNERKTDYELLVYA